MIAIGCDHGGFALKQEIIKYLNEKNIAFKDFGTDSEASVNYAPIAAAVGHSVASGECEKGILICGTGIGMSMAANKVKLHGRQSDRSRRRRGAGGAVPHHGIRRRQTRRENRSDSSH